MWTPVIQTLKSYVQAARGFGFPLLERGCSTQPVILGSFSYLRHVANPLIRVSRSVQRSANSFVWTGGTELLSQPALGQPRDCGGISFSNVSVAALNTVTVHFNGNEGSSRADSCKVLPWHVFTGFASDEPRKSCTSIDGCACSTKPSMTFHSHLSAAGPDVDITFDKVVEITGAILLPLVPPDRRPIATRFHRSGSPRLCCLVTSAILLETQLEDRSQLGTG